MLQQRIRFFHISVGELLFAAAAALAIVAIFSYDHRLVLAVPLVFCAVLFLRRPSVIVYVLIAFAFMQLDAWLSFSLSVPFGKVLFLFTVVSLSAVVLLTGSRLNRPGLPVLFYGAFLVTIFVFGAIEATRNGVKLWFEDTLYAVTYFVTLYMLINRWERLEKIIFLLFLVGIIISVLNIVELFHPSEVALSHSLGRSAGLLKNANTSAFIVNLSMIASFYVFRMTRSAKNALIVVLIQVLFFFGVFTTFSREGIFLFTFLFLAQFFFIRQRFRRILVISLAGAILAAGTIKVVQYITTSAVYDVRFSFQKYTTLVQGRLDDNDRIWLLKFHLKRFLERPLTGNGLYSALIYSIPTVGISQTDAPNGPHNTFVMILSEAGIFPLVAYLIFLVLLFRNLWGQGDGGERGRAMRCCLLLLFVAHMTHHFFSHMLLLARFSMVLFALFALPRRVFSPPVSR